MNTRSEIEAARAELDRFQREIQGRVDYYGGLQSEWIQKYERATAPVKNGEAKSFSKSKLQETLTKIENLSRERDDLIRRGQQELGQLDQQYKKRSKMLNLAVEAYNRKVELHKKQRRGADGYFDGQPIKMVYGATGRRDRFEFYYGGSRAPDGPGHGHVVSNDGVNIHYWREPNSSTPVIDDKWSSEQLSRHGL